ncbi:beta-lactamase family protein [Chitiniphilus purpureus]|uniref:Beta-lactamase family protein n=1 Tax=Chitiniphilus purpureus TaxID=2981137 RepID=A0ABY6DS67_9NEIS|nr:serine hydrolase domain-containing protein [Chitiniphilus sp. CD1]UXY17209.1 beta-lactamase family protein [Chitiniphilus sp. CD1]
MLRSNTVMNTAVAWMGALLLALAPLTHAAEQAAPFAADLDRAIDRAVAEQRIVGAVVLVAQDGRLVYQRAAGLADRERNIPMREDALFLLASVTKPIVSMAALKLIEQGRLSLNDPVTKWLPSFRPRTEQGETPRITVHQLLTHTAGLTYDFMQPPDGSYQRLGVSNGFDWRKVSLEQNLKRLARAPLVYEPGTAWVYSMATDVLGAVVAKAHGSSLPEAIDELVTRPLGIHDTAFRVVYPSRLVTPYFDHQPEPKRMAERQQVVFMGEVFNFAPDRLLQGRPYPSGGAGMAGSAGSVLAILDTLHGHGRPLLQPDTVKLATQAHVGPQAQTNGPGWGFGYGWGVLVDPAAASTPQSAGTLQWGGAYGHIWFVDPARRLSVVALTNTAFEGMAGQFTTDVRDAVYGVGVPPAR